MADQTRTTRSPARVRVSRTNLNDGYLITPNDLFRGHGVYRGLSEFARVLLGAGLSCADAWETTLADIEGWLPSLGRNRHAAVRRELRERGFLRQSPIRIEAGRPDSGEFIWSYEFFMDPLPEDERDRLQPKTATPRRGRSQVGAEPTDDDLPDADLSDGIDKTAGRTTPLNSGHRNSGHGARGHGESGHRARGHRGSGTSYKEEKNHRLEEPLTTKKTQDRSEKDNPDIPSEYPRSDILDTIPASTTTAVQPALDGTVTQPAAKADYRDEAFGIARDWIEHRKQANTPVVHRDPLHAVASLVKPFLVAGYTANEIKHALNLADTGLPTSSRFDTALAEVRNGKRRPVQRGSGSMTGINRHIDDLTPEQRWNENPFRFAITADEPVPAGSNGRGRP